MEAIAVRVSEEELRNEIQFATIREILNVYIEQYLSGISDHMQQMNNELREIVQEFEISNKFSKSVVRDRIIAATVMYPTHQDSFLSFIEQINPNIFITKPHIPTRLIDWRSSLFNDSFYNFIKELNNQIRHVYASNNDFNTEKVDPLMTLALQSATEMVKHPTTSDIFEHYKTVSRQMDKFFSLISSAGQFSYINAVDLNLLDGIQDVINEFELSDSKLPLYILYDVDKYTYYIPGLDKTIPNYMKQALLLEVIRNGQTNAVKRLSIYESIVEKFEDLYKLNSDNIDVNMGLTHDLVEKIQNAKENIRNIIDECDTELNREYLHTLYAETNIWNIVADSINRLIIKGKDVIVRLSIVSINNDGKQLIKHSNILVFIVNNKMVELDLFEPAGIVGIPAIRKLSRKLLRFVRDKVILDTSYKLQYHMTPLDKLPFGIIGPQEHTRDQMCVMWSIYYGLLRVLHRNVKRDEVKAMTLGVLSE